MQILSKVTDVDFEDVDRFTMIKDSDIHGIQLDTIRPQSHEGGHWEMNYVLDIPRNYILRV